VSRDQLTLYTIAVKLKWNIEVKQASFFMLPTNKFNYFTFTDYDKDLLIKQFQAAADDILTNKEKLPAKYNDKCKYCPFYGDCDQGKTEQKVINLEEGPVSFNNFGVDL
jgi:CRISPR/Cas system-associated exonuclease Cas4 (RecB family)